MKILIVEDEVRIAQNIQKGLAQEGFSVDMAHDGEVGFDLASTEEYSVIVLDLMLPVMDGVTVCKKLREDDNHTPILMLTAKGGLVDKVHGLNTGADDYLVKPFAFDELLARIRALGRRPIKSTGNVLKVADLELDTINSTVSRAGKNVDLSKKEFELLEYLMLNKGQIISKEKLVQNVWDFDADILPNTVEVYINYLRNKLEKPFSGDPIIKTVRGFGYKIE